MCESNEFYSRVCPKCEKHCPDMSFYTSSIGKLSTLCPKIKDFGYNLGLVNQMPMGEMWKMAVVRALLPQPSLLSSMSLTLCFFWGIISRGLSTRSQDPWVARGRTQGTHFLAQMAAGEWGYGVKSSGGGTLKTVASRVWRQQRDSASVWLPGCSSSSSSLGGLVLWWDFGNCYRNSTSSLFLIHMILQAT